MAHRTGMAKETSPIAINAQNMVNCVKGSDCNGGYQYDVYKYAHDVGAVHESCLQYDATNDGCVGTNATCQTCSGTVPSTDKEEEKVKCTAIKNPTRYWIGGYREF